MLSLPPKVSGRVNGHLVMKVDEVIWSQKPIDDVLAVVMWWGGETATTFRPVNIARYASVEDTTDVVYEIRTSLPLFEKYLRKCGTLRIVVTDVKGTPIGIVRIPEVYQVILASPFENYFPIVTSSETRIGDLHVVFQLIKSKQPCPTNLTEKSSEVLNKKNDSAIIDGPSDPLHTLCDSKLHNAKKTFTLKNPEAQSNNASSRSKSMPVRSHYRGRSRDNKHQSSKRDVHRTSSSDPENSQRKPDSCISNKKKLSCDDLDDIFSQILERGQKLQKAITLSVIEDEMPGTALSDPVALLHSHCNSSEPPQAVPTKKCSGKLMTGDFGISDEIGSPKERHVSDKDKNKVICYLQGKTMTAKEENEALEILRGMSPTEGFLHELKDYCMKPVHEQSKILSGESFMNESSQDDIVAQKSSSKNNIKPRGWLPLHQVNCVRLSVIKLILNAVGFKRVNASFPSKGKSGIRLPLSGLTFFVEYKWPLSNTSSRPWAENISRFCSKRQVNDEILFNDYAIHNVSTLSEQDAANTLITLLSKIVFRVCARQINQRVPIILGEGSLSSISDLLNSSSLSQEFLAPVIAADNIFVASLNIRIELGRDRIHFGGPLLSCGQKASDESDYSNPCQTGGDGPNTANLTITKTSQEQADLRRAVGSSDKSTSINRPTHPPKNSSGTHQRTHSTRPNLPTSVSQQTIGTKLAPAKKDPKLIAQNKFGYVNHDLAITVQRISDCRVVSGISPQNVHFIIAYRFPSWDATKLTTIEWQDFCTDPAMCKEDLHFFGANTVHSSLLPGSETFLSFLRDALEVRGADSSEGIEFILFFRSYYPKICDTPTAMALLPLDTIATLEAAFVDAAASNVNFTESSCASVMMDLPLQRIRNNIVLGNEPAIGILHLKLDYRHTYVRPIQREGSGDSQVDPFTEENLPYDKRKILSEDSFPHPLKHPWSLPPNIQTVNTVHVPNIALAIHKIGKLAEKYPVWLGGDDRKDECVADGSLRSRRIETVFVTDPSDSFGSEVDRQEKDEDLSKTQHTCHRHEEYGSSGSEESLPRKSVAHAGTRTEDVMTCTERSEALSIGVQTSPIRGSTDLSVEVDVAEAAPLRSEPREPVKLRDASTSTDTPFQNDQELQTFLPGRAAGCQTTESLTCLTFPKSGVSPRRSAVNGKKEVENSQRPSQPKMNQTITVGQAICMSNVDNLSKNIESQAGTKKSATESETVPHVEEESDEHTQLSFVGMRDSIQTSRLRENSLKVGSERRPSVDVRPTEESPRTSDRRPTIESKRRGVTSVVQSRRSTLERPAFATEPDKGVASGDKPPMGLTNFETQTRLIEGGSETSIPARVEVDCALHLPECENSVTFVTVHTDKAESGQEILRATEQLISPPVASARDVYWNWSCQIDLPLTLFLEEERRLIFRVWQRRGKENSAEVLGSAAVDLTVLTAGLPVIDGWFNILDISGISHGQIKVAVAPQQEACDRILPRLITLSEKKVPSNTEPVSLYLAQGMYRKFPSHLSHYDDILVQKVQNILGMCDAFESQDSSKRSDLNAPGSLPYEIVPARKENLKEGTAGSHRKDALALLKYLEQAAENSTTYDEDNQIESNLRDTLTELDRLTSKMKERIRTCDFRGSFASSEHPRTEAANSITGAISKHKSPFQSKSGSHHRPSAALERVNAWECDSSENIYTLDSPKKSRKPEKNPIDQGSRSRPQLSHSRSVFPLWEQDGDEDRESTPIGGPEDQEISDWIADAAMREMMNVRLFSPLFFPDIVVVPKVSSYPRKEVKVIEIDDTNEARFSDSHGESASDNASTPINSEARTMSMTENPNETPANEADSGVDVDHSSTLSRRNKSSVLPSEVCDQEKSDSQQRSDPHRFSCDQPCNVEQDSNARKSDREQRPSEEVTFNIPRIFGQQDQTSRSDELRSDCPKSTNSQQRRTEGEPCGDQDQRT